MRNPRIREGRNMLSRMLGPLKKAPYASDRVTQTTQGAVSRMTLSQAKAVGRAPPNLLRLSFSDLAHNPLFGPAARN